MGRVGGAHGLVADALLADAVELVPDALFAYALVLLFDGVHGGQRGSSRRGREGDVRILLRKLAVFRGPVRNEMPAPQYLGTCVGARMVM